jgi:Fe-S cluster biogenesis protein NfuA
MTAPDPAQAAADRVDGLLEQLRSGTDPRAALVADELVRCLVQLYGDGLTRIMHSLGPERVADLCADPLVESLLLVHDLHPMDAGARVRQALAQAHARIGDVDVLGIDGGVVRLRLRTGGQGCGSRAVVSAIEEIVQRAAPETTGVDVQSPPPQQPLLQVGLRPGIGRPTSPAEVGS